ncbi:MAG TPA: hypothetical protein ENJ79_02450 [Gammaproteobacteria bacterium]|nr:hypothetical protein [Gammaproteobacteria bacterium]
MKPVRKKKATRAFALVSLLWLPLQIQADARVELEFRSRTPNQMRAFYLARGFERRMLDALQDQCFITVRITNTGDRVVWLDLTDWRFEYQGKPLVRPHRRDWLARWARMGVPRAHRSTFRWTLLPERLDYQPGEREGGNIILPRVEGKIRLHARFATGPDGKGPPLEQDHLLQCAKDNAETMR